MDNNLRENVRNLKIASWGEEILFWIKDNNIRTERGDLLEFDKHRFLKDIFEDWTPVQVSRKASQIGFSTMAILKSLYASKYRKLNQIYTLPTFGDVGQFVPSKVNPIIQANTMLSEWTKDKDTTFQKKVGDRFIYYRGTSSNKTQREKMESGTGIMLSSDLNIHDESDRSDQTIIEQYESRLEASEFKGKWYFSNPTSPGTLTQRLWDKSDQKHWFVKCPKCGHLQWLDYYKNVDKSRGIFVCQACKKELSDETRKNGFWVKKYKNRDISGYWISHLICPWISAKELIEAEETKTKQYFYNFNLGLPYRGSDIVVDKETILKNIIYNEPNFKTENVIGVDTGTTMYYVLGNKQGIFKTGSAKDWDDIIFLMKKYNARGVFDALGDLTNPRKLRDAYRGKIWLCYFKKDKDTPKAIKWDGDEMAVYADRSKIIQVVIDEFVDGNMKFYNMNPEDLIDYIKHWETLYQIEEEDSLGIVRKKWETEGENHFLFATIYFYLALQRAGRGSVVSWQGEDKTPKAHDPRAPDPKEAARKMLEGGKQDWRL
jgi:hypothetical protein